MTGLFWFRDPYIDIKINKFRDNNHDTDNDYDDENRSDLTTFTEHELVCFVGYADLTYTSS